jgi:hypothetical protein
MDLHHLQRHNPEVTILIMVCSGKFDQRGCGVDGSLLSKISYLKGLLQAVDPSAMPLGKICIHANQPLRSSFLERGR